MWLIKPKYIHFIFSLPPILSFSFLFFFFYNFSTSSQPMQAWKTLISSFQSILAAAHWAKPENRVKWFKHSSLREKDAWMCLSTNILSLRVALGLLSASGLNYRLLLQNQSMNLISRTFMIAVLKDIVMIPVRSTPWDSEKELDELYDVFLMVRDKWKTDVSSIVLLNPFFQECNCITSVHFLSHFILRWGSEECLFFLIIYFTVWQLLNAELCIWCWLHSYNLL